MDEILSELKKIGIKAIAQKTLMTEQSVKAIINRDFKSLQKTKAIGFVKIIEREFKVDFTEWIEEYNRYLNESEPIEEQDHFVMSEPSKDKGTRLINVFTYFIIFISVIALFYILSDINTKDNENKEEIKPVKELVEEAKVNLEITKELNESILLIEDIKESNETVSEDNSSEEVVVVEEVEETPTPTPPIKTEIYIEPRIKVWVGVITLPNYRKKTFITGEKFNLETSKEQLISLGHNKIDMYLDGKKVDTEGKEKFHYKDGKIESLTFAEFRDLNRGRNW